MIAIAAMSRVEACAFMLVSHFEKLLAKASGQSSETAEPKKTDQMTGEGDLPPSVPSGVIEISTDPPLEADPIVSKEIDSEPTPGPSRHREEVTTHLPRPRHHQHQGPPKKKVKKTIPLRRGDKRYYLGPPSDNSDSD